MTERDGTGGCIKLAEVCISDSRADSKYVSSRAMGTIPCGQLMYIYWHTYVPDVAV